MTQLQLLRRAFTLPSLLLRMMAPHRSALFPPTTRGPPRSGTGTDLGGADARLSSPLLASGKHPTFATLPRVTGTPNRFHDLDIALLFLGRYIGILTLVPLALMIKLRRPQPWRIRLAGLIGSSPMQECQILMLPTLLLLYWINQHVSEDLKQTTRMAMLLPAAWLTMKHGWRGTAVGIAAAVSCIFMDLEPRYEQLGYEALDVIATQSFIAFSITSLFALSIYVSERNAAEERERLDAKTAVNLAQQGLYLCEVRMRQASQALERVAGALQVAQARLLDRFKHVLPLRESEDYYAQMTRWPTISN